jgi:hypothetical protein
MRCYAYSGQSGALLHEAEGIEGNRFGYSLNSASDVNQDGTPDYIVGGARPANRIVVYSSADHSLLHNLTTLPGAHENFGASVAAAGDVNNDGVPDLLVGANRADVSETITDTGRVYLLSGSDGGVIWEQLDDTPQGLLGSGLGQVGDVSGDGVPDQVAAAPGAGENGLGEAYVYSGVDGAILYTLQPVKEATSGGTFGTFFAAGAGDVNADGSPDIFVGDYGAVRGGAAGVGRAYIYSGVDGPPFTSLKPKLMATGWGQATAFPTSTAMDTPM